MFLWRSRPRRSGTSSGVSAAALGVLFSAGFWATPAHSDEQKFDLSLPPDTLIAALKQLRTQTDSQIVYSPLQLDGAVTAGLSGAFTVAEALAILLKDTSFAFKRDERGTIVIAPTLAAARPEPEPALPIRPEPPSIEEITVTAEKREEVAKDVPASVSALTGNMLSELGLNGIDDYGSYVPGLIVLSNQRGFGQVVLRGITTGTNQPTASVGTYIDDVPYGSSTAFAGGNLVIADIDPFDIQRIEVARGPQGTLYGAGTLAGVLKYVTTAPELGTLISRAEIDTGSTKGGGLDEAAKALINVPLGDHAALRADVYERHDSGFINDTGTGNRNENFSDVQGGRLSLLVKPLDDLTVRFTSLFQARRVGGTPSIDVDPANLQPVAGDLTQSRLLRESASQQYQLHDLSVSWDLGAASLFSTTSYGRSLAHAETDDTENLGQLLQLFSGLRAIPAVSFPTGFTTDKFTEEVRLASTQSRPFNWLIGTFYTYEWSNARDSLHSFLHDVPLATTIASPFSQEEPSRFREYAGFGDVDYYFLPDVDLTAGMRWSRNRQSFDQTSSGLLNNIGNPQAVTTSLGASAGSSLTFRLAPRWRIDDNLTAYAEASSGYRPGGPNVPHPNSLFGASAVPTSFAADSLVNYETGIKSELFDKRLSFDAAAFLIDWRHIQLQSATSGFTVETNGGAATSRGVELAAGYHPVSGLVLGLSGAYTQAMLTADAPSIGGLKGDPLPTVPRWSGGATADYEFPAFGVWEGTLGASYRRIGDRNSSFNHDIQNPNLHLPGYGELDLRAGLAADDRTITLFIDNVLNERGAVDIQNQISPPGTPARETVIRPLSVGLQLTLAF
ncbi:MAG: iron complex outerrane recepter protein [Aliidongia sp.]|jgi:outer membrane receptor protein involved in Fe transport|nr:iron complex outerrane recepter protein [Aliidongia sp.]